MYYNHHFIYDLLKTYTKQSNAYWCHAKLNEMGQVTASITYNSLFLFVNPWNPTSFPTSRLWQEPYKIAANQASVISHQSLSKQKQMWEYVYFWMALHKCEKFVGLKISQDSTFGRLSWPRLLHGAVIKTVSCFLVYIFILFVVALV